ncbi:MAG: hypothetical protein Q8R00_04320 [Candidatus Nanoarchaeia archaeon]|nr:hypothetical protein [Candidatus Nanoarchaeia archaeon]
MTIETKVNENIRFLKDIQSRVVKIERRMMETPWKGRGTSGMVDLPEYLQDNPITRQELNKIKKIVVTEDLLMYPQTMNMGFNVGYVIEDIIPTAPGLKPDRNNLLFFLDKQVDKNKPKEHIYEELAKIFRRDRNYELARIAGLEDYVIKGLSREYSYHDY